MSQFENIREISINTKENVTVFINDMVSIESLERLELAQRHIDAKLVVAVEKFTNLRQLTLEECRNDGVLVLTPPATIDFVNLVAKLRNFRFLTLNLTDFELDASTRDKINEIVSERKQSLTILTNTVEKVDRSTVQIKFGNRVVDTK